MKLNEIFSGENTYEVKDLTNDISEFTSENGNTYRIIVNTKPDRSNMNFSIIEFSFRAMNSKDRYDTGHKVNNSGDEFKILNTVITTLTKKLDNMDLSDISRIEFFADSSEKSRIKLFDRIAQRMAKRYTNFNFSKEENTVDTFYVFRNKKK